MKKLFFISALLVVFGAKSQEFHHALGAGGLFGIFNQEYTTSYSTNVTANEIAYVPGIMYKATLGFDITRNSSFGATASPFLGFFISNYGSYLGYQLPLMAEYYIGDIDDNCFYLGGGFSYGFVNDGVAGGPVLGPVLGLGGQFEFRDRLYGLRGNYTIGVNKERDIPTGWESTRDSRGMLSLSLYTIF